VCNSTSGSIASMMTSFREPTAENDRPASLETGYGAIAVLHMLGIFSSLLFFIAGIALMFTKDANTDIAFVSFVISQATRTLANAASLKYLNSGSYLDRNLLKHLAYLLLITAILFFAINAFRLFSERETEFDRSVVLVSTFAAVVSLCEMTMFMIYYWLHKLRILLLNFAFAFICVKVAVGTLVSDLVIRETHVVWWLDATLMILVALGSCYVAIKTMVKLDTKHQPALEPKTKDAPKEETEMYEVDIV